MESQKQNLIVNLSFQFSLDIVKYTTQLELLKKYNISNQLFRSATSIGANIREAQHAESRRDFIHKLKIASKEAAETTYWLEICKHCENLPDSNSLLRQVESINKILSKIIFTTKTQLRTTGIKKSEP